MILLDAIYPYVNPRSNISELYLEAYTWSWLYLPLFFTAIMAFFVSFYFGKWIGYRICYLSIFLATLISTLLASYAIQFTGEQLSDVVLYNLIQMFMMLNATVFAYLIQRFRNTELHDRDGLRQRFNSLSLVHQISFATLIFLVAAEVNSLRIFIWILLLFVCRAYLKRRAKPTSKHNSVLRSASISTMLALVIIPQVLLLNQPIAEVACKIPYACDEFNCEYRFLSEGKKKERDEAQMEAQLSRQRLIYEREHRIREENRQNALREETKAKEEKRREERLKRIEHEMNEERRLWRISKAQVLYELSQATDFSKPSNLLESNYHQMLEGLLSGYDERTKMRFIRPQEGELERMQLNLADTFKKSDIAEVSIPTLLTYLLITYKPIPYLDSLKMVGYHGLIDDFYQRFENGIVFEYDYLPEQGSSYRCLIPTDDIEWVRELMVYLLRDFNADGDSSSHYWVTPNYFGTEGVGCHYNIDETQFGILVTNYCGS